jgi:hypothetical protein
VHVEDPTDSSKIIGRIAFAIVDESGKIDPNGVLTPEHEPYDDADSDGTWDDAETFTDTNSNGLWDWAEPYTDSNSNGSWDSGEPYTDENQNGSHDTFESFTDTNSNGQFDTAEHYLDVNGDGTCNTSSLSEGSEVRRGGSPQEVNLDNILPSGITTSHFISKMPSTLKKWFSWEQIFSAGISGLGSSTAPTCLARISPYSYDIEAYRDNDTEAQSWIDDGDQIAESGEYTDSNSNGRYDGQARHRFNLSSLKSAAFTKLANANESEGFWDYSASPLNPATGNPAECIPWLASMTADSDLDGNGTPAESSDHIILRKQVAANLIDYCDSNDKATTDYSEATGTDWDAGFTLPSASYVGLEKVPYINEIRFDAQIYPPVSGEYSLTLRVWVELINIYDDDLYNWDALRVDVGFPTQISTGNADPNKGKGNTFTSWSKPPGTKVPSHGYLATMGEVTFKWNGTDTVDLSVNKLAATLYATGGVADFAFIGTPAPHSYTLKVGVDETTYGNVEVEDPRHNTQASSWHWHSESFNSWDPIDVEGSMYHATAPIVEGNNSAYNSNMANPSNPIVTYSDFDNESATMAKNLSTAYIRNGPMQSLWELGAIHRGEAWRTINLHSYTTSPNGSYAQGDWKLLDQCKLSTKGEVRGRVNANTPLKDVWKTLLSNVTVGGGYASPGDGTPLDDTWTAGTAIYDIVNDSTDGILYKNGVQAGTPLSSRGAILSCSKLTNNTEATQDNDRAQEEIIGKIANLLTTRQNYFTVIVVGQAVKYLPGITSPTTAQTTAHPEWQEYDTNKWCSVLGEQKIMAVVYRDALANTYKIERWEYLDD